MARRLGTDRFANIAAALVTESAAGTITFTEVLTGISLGVGVGIIIDEIDYWFDRASIGQLIVNADQLTGGWTVSNDVPVLSDVEDRRILHITTMNVAVSGTPASIDTVRQPAVYQFFPPIILASPRLYLATVSVGASAAIVLRSRIYFRFVDLSAQEYLEIAETFQLTG